MDSRNFKLLSAILFASLSTLLGSNTNSWNAYSDTSSFRDVLNGRSYEDTFGSGGDPYESLFSSSLSGGYGGGGGGGGGGGSGGSSYGQQEKSPIRVIQQRSDSDYSGQSSGQRYNSPAVTVRSGHRNSGGSSYGSNSHSSYGDNKQYSPQTQTKTRQTSKGGYSKPSYSSTSSKTQQQHHQQQQQQQQQYQQQQQQQQYQQQQQQQQHQYQQQSDSDYDSGSGGYSEIPDTGFQCLNRYYGYYADVDAGCQIFHVCQPDGRKWSFWCPNGTLYHQKVQTCDWWYNVDCPASTDYYFLNERIGVLPPQDATLHRF